MKYLMTFNVEGKHYSREFEGYSDLHIIKIAKTAIRKIYKKSPRYYRIQVRNGPNDYRTIKEY
jgi:hypothetical protein